MVCIYNSIFFVFFTGHHFDHIEQCWPLQEMDNLIRWNRAAYVQGSLLTGGAYSSSEFVLQGLTSTVNVCLEWNSCRDYVRSWDASSVVWFIGDVCRWFQALIVLIVTVVNVVPFRFTMGGHGSSVYSISLRREYGMWESITKQYIYYSCRSHCLQ